MRQVVPKPITLWRTESRGALGHKELFFPNPQNTFALHLLRKPEAAPVYSVHDITGADVSVVDPTASSQPVTTLAGKRSSGIQTRTWTPARGMKPGNYSVRCKLGEQTLIQPFTIVADPRDERSNAATSEAR